MKIIVLLVVLIIALSLFFGCTGVVSELGSCMDKCGGLCKLAKDNNFDLGGYNSLQIQKNSGGVKISCGCPCE